MVSDLPIINLNFDTAFLKNKNKILWLCVILFNFFVKSNLKGRQGLAIKINLIKKLFKLIFRVKEKGKKR